MIFTPFAFMQPAGAPLDPDAATYISAVTTAGGSLSGAEETAISTFFTDLKSAGVYSQLHAMYPFLGGVANAHKINAVNPGTYDLTFNGTWTHSNAAGSSVSDDGVSYADTGLDPSLFNSTTDFSFGQMIANAGSANGYSGIGTGASRYLLLGQASNNLDTWNGGAFNLTGAPGYQNGAFHINNRTASNNWYRHYASSGASTALTTDTKTNGVTSYSATLWINDVNGLSGNTLSGDYRFFFMGTGMTIAEMQDLTDAMNSLQAAFSREIFV